MPSQLSGSLPRGFALRAVGTSMLKQGVVNGRQPVIHDLIAKSSANNSWLTAVAVEKPLSKIPQRIDHVTMPHIPFAVAAQTFPIHEITLTFQRFRVFQHPQPNSLIGRHRIGRCLASVKLERSPTCNRLDPRPRSVSDRQLSGAGVTIPGPWPWSLPWCRSHHRLSRPTRRLRQDRRELSGRCKASSVTPCRGCRT